MVEHGICQDCGKFVAPGAETLHPRYCESPSAVMRRIERQHDGLVDGPAWIQTHYVCPGCDKPVEGRMRSEHPRHCTRTHGEPDDVPEWVSRAAEQAYSARTPSAAHGHPKSPVVWLVQVATIALWLFIAIQGGWVFGLMFAPVLLANVVFWEWWARTSNRKAANLALGVYSAVVAASLYRQYRLREQSGDQVSFAPMFNTQVNSDRDPLNYGG